MLECKDIDLFYGSSQALRSVSMKAEIGKVTCVLGRNGVGKTSLIRALLLRISERAFRRALDTVLILLSLNLIWQGTRALLP